MAKLAEWWQTLRALWAGTGIGRILMDRTIASCVDLKGSVIDIGGRGEHSYHRLLDTAQVESFFILDIDVDDTVDAAGSVIALPLVSDCCDAVLCFNVLEHVLDYEAALQEILRVLRSGGSFYGRVPFMMNVHADPYDYWRYTRTSLEHLLARNGFDTLSIEVDGGLFLVILNLLEPLLRRSFLLRFVVVPCLLSLDAIFSMILGATVNRERYPLGYTFSAKAGMTDGNRPVSRAESEAMNDMQA